MRHIRRIKCAALLLAVLMLLTSCGLGPPADPVTGSDFVLDTISSITVYSQKDAEHIDRCFDICREYESIFSRTIAESDIGMLNSRRTDAVSGPTAELISFALEYCELSGGSLDISLGGVTSLWDFTAPDGHVLPDPDELASALAYTGYENVSINGTHVTLDNPGVMLDLGAVAKGYIADRLKDYLTSDEVGVTSGYINLGGNVLCIGKKPDGSSYVIGVQYPFGEGVIATVEGSDMSVVTSGVYERSFELDGRLYHHILDPRTGYPAETGLLSVTIVSEGSAVGDALSTACFVLGLEDGMELIDSIDGVYAIFVTEDYSLHYSEGLTEHYKVTAYN